MRSLDVPDRIAVGPPAREVRQVEGWLQQASHAGRRGRWERVTALMAQADADEDLNWAVSVDSTIVRAHQHAAAAGETGPGRRAGRSRHRPVPPRTDHEHSPRTRRELPPLAFVLGAGQAGEAPAFPEVMARSLRSPPTRTAWHQSRRIPGPQGLLLSAIREHLRERGIRAFIP